MSFSLLIARRYLFSRKSTRAINVISAISMVGVAVTTMALVIVLSVFNGFHDLVASMLTNFDPQLRVVPAVGKTAAQDDAALDSMRRLPSVAVATDFVEDEALAVYNGRQAMVSVMGVDDNFTELTRVDDILYGDGSFHLHAANLEYGVPGIRLAQQLGIGAEWTDYLHVYAPRREGQLRDLAEQAQGFVTDSLLSPGLVFAVGNGRYDRQTLLVSAGFARRLFGQEGQLTSVAFRLKPGSDLDAVKRDMRQIAAGRFLVQDRLEQQADTFRIMQVEKVIAYFFLTFILIIACFNVIGSLSMLIIEKQDDARLLRALGASERQVRRIFLYEGRLICLVGAVAGIALGLLLCWLQQQFGLVPMGSASGTFVVDAYPVSVHYADVAVVFLTVLAVGCAAAWYPVRRSFRG